jgi:hypothetical protein
MSDRERDAAWRIERERIDLADRLRLRLAEALDAILAYMLSSIPESAGKQDRRYVSGWREVIRACLECGLLAIEHGEDWAGPVPAISLAQARRGARNGVELAVVLDRHRAVYQIAWDFVLEEIAASKTPEPHRTILLREVSVAAAALLARLLTEVTQAHAEEIERGVQSSAQRREQLVRRALSGRHVDRRELDYDLEGEHLALIATGMGATRALKVLAQGTGRRLLLLEQDDGTVCAWLGGPTRLLPAVLVRHVLNGAHADVTFAVGPPARGLPGFRRTHRLAQATLLVARNWPQRITLHEDVRLLAHALQDEDYAMSLIDMYIAPLEGARDQAALRETLTAFYEVGRDEEKAARSLEVHRHTVQRRLRRVEGLIGCPLDGHHGEMNAALKLAEASDGPGRSVGLRRS